MTRLFCLLLVLLFPCLHYSQVTLSPHQLQEDFEQVKETIEKKNPGLFLFISEEEFNTHYEELKQQLQEPKDLIEFYGIVKQLIVPVGERHLSVNGFAKGAEINQQFKDGHYKLFPLTIRFQNDSTAYAIRNLSEKDAIEVPSKIISINESDIGTIRNRMAQFVSKDYGNNTWENWEIERTFPLSYFFHIDTTSTFQVVWQDSLKTKQTTTLKGITLKQYRDSLVNKSKQVLNVDQLLPRLQTDYYPSIKTGYLKIGSFSEQIVPDAEDGFITYKEIVKRFFRTVEKYQYKQVIIDLRNNTGGKVDYVNYLLSFIVKNKEPKKIYYNERDRAFWFGKNTNTGFIQQRKRLSFDGELYILTNGGSYSASVMVAAFAKDLADATLVGIEPGGRFDGTTAGRFHVERLKHSDILIRIPEALFEYYYDNETTTSLKPDIEVREQPSDYFSYQQDHQLETLLRILQQKSTD